MLKSRSPEIAAIVQARMGSSRLPGKVLKDIAGKPMLNRVVIRARRSQLVGQVIVATTTDPADDPLEVYCESLGFPCFRGDPYDVLDRYYQAARLYQARTIVRLTADCPLIDPGEIDRTIQAFLQNRVDFAANRLPPPWKRTTPIGMDTEVVTFNALAEAWENAEAKYAREHVMPYFYEKPGRFKIVLVDHQPDLSHLRLTVDTKEDLELVREIFHFFNNKDNFSLSDMLGFLEQHPEILEINRDVKHKSYQDIDRRS